MVIFYANEMVILDGRDRFIGKNGLPGSHRGKVGTVTRTQDSSNPHKARGQSREGSPGSAGPDPKAWLFL